MSRDAKRARRQASLDTKGHGKGEPTPVELPRVRCNMIEWIKAHQKVGGGRDDIVWKGF